MSGNCGTLHVPAEDQALEASTDRTETTGKTRGRPPLDPEKMAVRQAREAVWLSQVRDGWRIAEIALTEGLSRRLIQLGVSRARHREDTLRIGDSRLRDVLRTREESRTPSPPPPSRWDASQPPVLVPLFPVQAFTPHSPCPHHGPIRDGSDFCCMVCGQSGMDDHPALQRDPRTDPRPESQPAPAAPASKPPAAQTRKQKRQLWQASRKAG